MFRLNQILFAAGVLVVGVTSSGCSAADKPGEETLPPPVQEESAETTPPETPADCGCKSDAECVKAVPGCCGCSSGGREVAVAAACVSTLPTCDRPPAEIACSRAYLCTERTARCVDGACTLK